MTMRTRTFLVLGAIGGTGRHFVSRCLADRHTVRALVRSPHKLPATTDGLDVRQGSIADAIDTDALVAGVDAVIAMLGDISLQANGMIVMPFCPQACAVDAPSRS